VPGKVIVYFANNILKRGENFMKTWATISIAVALLTLGTFNFLPVGSAAEEKSIEQMITGAKTPADHEAIAAFYEQQAQEAQKKHEAHKKMEETYKKNPALNKSNFSFHCDRIAASYQTTAKEYEDLAKMHKEMAQSAK
jgi:hypothetical protein